MRSSETSKDPIVAAHKHCSRHRDEIISSEQCGCFYCLRIFSPGEIKEWVDEVDNVGATAICPHCEIDSVIGSRSGYPITREFLGAMKKHWFLRAARAQTTK
jgi:hypothetical protein